MTTFTTEDLENLKTDWFPVDIFPAYEGEYEVLNKHWPWPHRAEWSVKSGWSIEIEQWRGLRIKIQ